MQKARSPQGVGIGHGKGIRPRKIMVSINTVSPGCGWWTWAGVGPRGEVRIFTHSICVFLHISLLIRGKKGPKTRCWPKCHTYRGACENGARMGEYALVAEVAPLGSVPVSAWPGVLGSSTAMDKIKKRRGFDHYIIQGYMTPKSETTFFVMNWLGGKIALSYNLTRIGSIYPNLKTSGC